MNVRKIFLHAALILLSVLFVYLLSHSTSPRFFFLGGDSAIFQVVGKYWAQGYLPYVDLFENKGALLFLINAIGYAIHPRTGIMLPQIILMYLSCLFLWRAIGLYSSGGTKIFFFAMTILYFAGHYWEGNNAGEFTLPFLSVSTYFFLRYVTAEKICPPLYGFIYGFSFGGCVLLRASNAMPTCCYAFLTAIFLLQAREFKNLLQNFLSFCAGFAVIVMPFVIYFAAHGALYDMLYGTILFNLSYTAQWKFGYETTTLIKVFAIHLMPAILLIFFSAISLMRDVQNKLAWSGLFVGAMMSLLLTNLRLYIHYYMIVAPIMPLLFAVFNPLRKVCWEVINSPHPSLKRFLCKVAVISLWAYSVACYADYSSRVATNLNSELLSQEEKIFREEVSDILQLRSLIPESERQSFACWGNFFSTCHWILVSDMKPSERFFVNNSVSALFAPQEKARWLQHVDDSSTMWILYGTSKDKKEIYFLDDQRDDPDVERLLAEKYTLRGEILIYDQIMRLYRLKG